MLVLHSIKSFTDEISKLPVNIFDFKMPHKFFLSYYRILHVYLKIRKKFLCYFDKIANGPSNLLVNFRSILIRCLHRPHDSKLSLNKPDSDFINNNNNNYKKAYDMVPHSWIMNCLKMYKISHEVINFIEKTMKIWRVELTAGGRSLAETKIQRGVFQGDALSSLLFIIATMPLNHILRKCTAGYKLSRLQEKINHLMYIDDIKLFAKNEKELETLIHTVRIYSQDIGMEFGIGKCAMLVIKSGKHHMTDGMELPNQDKIRTLGENETYKYLRILEADTIKQVEMEDTIQKEYIRRTRKQVETKLSSRNFIKGINTWAVALVRYSGPFLKSTRDELRKMDQRTRKLMTLHKALHPRDHVDRLYVSRKEGGRGLASIEDSVNASIQRMRNPESIQENETHKLLWDFDIQTDYLISSRRPDLVIINK